MKMKWYIVIFSTLLIACNSNKDTGESASSKAEEKQEQYEQEDSTKNYAMAEVSVKTKMFLADLEKELENTTADPFVPSDELINKYNLIEVRGTYYVGGFIQIGDGFNEKNLQALGVNIGSSSGKIRTCQVPILEVDKMLELDGIRAFNISEKTLPK